MSSAQASREATIAPAALAYLMVLSASHPGEEGVAQRPSESVTGAETVDDVDLYRGSLGDAVFRAGEHAVRARA